jgi:hypothetical protein
VKEHDETRNEYDEQALQSAMTERDASHAEESHHGAEDVEMVKVMPDPETAGDGQDKRSTFRELLGNLTEGAKNIYHNLPAYVGNVVEWLGSRSGNESEVSTAASRLGLENVEYRAGLRGQPVADYVADRAERWAMLNPRHLVENDATIEDVRQGVRARAVEALAETKGVSVDEYMKSGDDNIKSKMGIMYGLVADVEAKVEADKESTPSNQAVEDTHEHVGDRVSAGIDAVRAAGSAVRERVVDIGHAAANEAAKRIDPIGSQYARPRGESRSKGADGPDV